MCVWILCSVWRTREDGSIFTLFQRLFAKASASLVIQPSVMAEPWYAELAGLVPNIYVKNYFAFDLLGLTTFYSGYLMVLYRRCRQPVVAMGSRRFTSLGFLGNSEFCRNTTWADVTGHVMVNELLSSTERSFKIETRCINCLLAPAGPGRKHSLCAGNCWFRYSVECFSWFLKKWNSWQVWPVWFIRLYW